MSDHAAQTIGVVGAGTMGAGIAQLACRAGATTLLYDPLPEALTRGAANLQAGLDKEASRGKLTAEQAREAVERLQPVEELEQLNSCELVIEAAPERLNVKHELYGRLSEIVNEQCVLASNTSSLPITAVADGATHPERVVGMHFFNPAPLMRLLEVIAGLLSDERALALAQATGRAMGKDVIRAADVPGFIVNRCNRPFGLEALRLLQERVADVETIDRIVRLGGGFRMGPFELSDLVGVDTGFDVSKSFYELSFGEPRWRPSPIQARQVAAGLHGRKTGRGYYDYSADGPHRPADPDPPAGGGDAIVTGSGPVADALRALTHGHGGPEIAVEGLGGTVDGEPFYAIVPLALVEVTGETGEQAFRDLGLHTERVQPAPAGVLARIVSQVINESAFALGEGVGSADDIDTGMMLGLSHPRGPFAWMREIGPAYVLSTIETLGNEYREERYRPAPALRRLAAKTD
ncbi:MAG TPA: 3-hydroxyacyl-CoA dehydrogenase NAD-binding domain-containing protein [Solirubrobacteraceae bacterium]|jgi:3-hydroxybutyryl-CoA dehydrogenase|nr:3-hydroxyacyl-CoA dehydrogenase NAD-binding domain-containing protein [Solirubrobacteraceae bacterium]